MIQNEINIKIETKKKKKSFKSSKMWYLNGQLPKKQQNIIQGSNYKYLKISMNQNRI